MKALMSFKMCKNCKYVFPYIQFSCTPPAVQQEPIMSAFHLNMNTLYSLIQQKLLASEHTQPSI